MAGRAYQPRGSYVDNLARERRRRFFIRVLASVLCGVMLVGVSAYALFYSGWMDINSISVNGLKSVTEDQISPTIKTMIERDIVPILQIRFQKNVLFFDPEPVKNAILSQFPVIKSIDISKKMPHEIIVNIVERTALGAWCFDRGSSTSFDRAQDKSLTTSCQYFDEEGVLWGKALRSSGSLLLNVDDLRPSEGRTKADVQLLAETKELVNGLQGIGLKVNKIEIPQDSIGEFKAYINRGYYLILDTDSDIENQVNILRILLKDKGESFKPQYIDLRVEGRAYYK
ncbi:MAG: FtsQ-type POTRA domain-containing protein [Candidatus Yanofskybacteria bacterium]|nr:FtsQ-type POTRA domain-containing protein [Candidatus Yanofskybacteria bacterium]